MRFAAIVLALLLETTGAGAVDFLDCRLVPGWEHAERTREFSADNLYEYLNGDAEGYLIYGFVRLQNAACKKGKESVVLDVFEMADADAAYGIFSARRDPDASMASIGMAGQIQPRRATFAKDKYFVELAAAAGGDSSDAVRAFATEIEKRITGRNTPPDTLSWFPKDKLVSVRLIPESVLGLRALKRGYVAQYEGGKAFIVLEESPESASAVFKKLSARFGEVMPAHIADEAFQVKDQYLGGLCFFRKGRYLAGYANLSDAATAAVLAQTLVPRIP